MKKKSPPHPPKKIKIPHGLSVLDFLEKDRKLEFYMRENTTYLLILTPVNKKKHIILSGNYD